MEDNNIRRKLINPIVLTNEQKTKILNLINADSSKPPSLKDMVVDLFPDTLFDGRSFEGKAIKEYLATLNVKAKSSSDNKYKQPFILTGEQELYIRNNYTIASITEMARALFNKQNISRINLEYKAIQEFLHKNNLISFDPKQVTNNPVVNTTRFIPKTIEQAARRVNKYVLNGIDISTLKKDTRIQNCLQAMIKYCHTPRYGLLMNTLSCYVDCELFESSFIRYVWDKPDITEEEVDSYINLCCDIVNYTKMQREVEQLVEMRDKCLDDSDGKRLSMALVAQMGELYKEMDNNQKRQNAALKNLTGTRNDRMEGRLRENASFLQAVSAWREENKRKRFLAIAEKRRHMIKEEIERLDNLDALKCEIWGLNKENFT